MYERERSRSNLALLAQLCLCAFALGSTACKSSSAEMRPVAELPESYRATREAWLADDPDWNARREQIEADPGLRKFVIDNLIIQSVSTEVWSDGKSA